MRRGAQTPSAPIWSDTSAPRVTPSLVLTGARCAAELSALWTWRMAIARKMKEYTAVRQAREESVKRERCVETKRPPRL